jgi:hypothetical protein
VVGQRHLYGHTATPYDEDSASKAIGSRSTWSTRIYDTMPVKDHVDDLKIDIVAFEARFNDGYRYLDRCGECLVQIQHHDRAWVVQGVNPQAGHLKNDARSALLTISPGALILQRLNMPIQHRGADAIVEQLAAEAEAVYEIIMDTLNINETTRVGARFRFLAEAETLEQADRFLMRGVQSDLLARVQEVTGSSIRDAALVYVVEDLESGHRRRVEIASQILQKPGEPPYAGFPDPSQKAGVSIDIDTFTRPRIGHFERFSMFSQNTFIRSSRIATEMFIWFRELQAGRTR